MLEVKKLFEMIWYKNGILTELVLGSVAPTLSLANATMTLLFSPAQWTTI